MTQYVFMVKNILLTVILTKGRVDTLNNFKEFLKGYNKHYDLSLKEKESLLAFIAIRHFDIQATIIEAQGLDCVDNNFFDNQLRWLEK